MATLHGIEANEIPFFREGDVFGKGTPAWSVCDLLWRAPVVLDQGDWRGDEKQTAGFDLYAAERGVEVLSLPTGHCLIFTPG